jgi:hypothetical protein
MRRAPRLQHVLQARSPHDRDRVDPGPPRQPEQHPPNPRVRRILNNKISGAEPGLLQHRPRRQRVDRQHRQLRRGQPRRQREQPACGHHHPLGPRPAVDQHAVADLDLRHAVADLGHAPDPLEPAERRQRRDHPVLALQVEQVGGVDRRRLERHQHVPGPQRRLWQIHDLGDLVGRPELGERNCSHVQPLPHAPGREAAP